MAAKIKVRVFHAYYGCETGCCGHIVALTMPDGTEKVTRNDFDHPFGDNLREWAEKYARDEIAIHFPECADSIDWSSLDISEVVYD